LRGAGKQQQVAQYQQLLSLQPWAWDFLPQQLQQLYSSRTALRLAMPQARHFQEQQQGLPLQGLAPAATQQQGQQQQARPLPVAVLLLMLLQRVARLMAVCRSRQELGPIPTQQQEVPQGMRLPLQLVLALCMTQPLNWERLVSVFRSRAATLLRTQAAMGTAAAAAAAQPARAELLHRQSHRQDPTAAVAAAGTALGQRQVLRLGPAKLGPAAAAMGLLLTPLQP
jgi:hypothetical protein